MSGASTLGHVGGVQPIHEQATEVLPTGLGLLSFRTVDDALSGVKEIRRDPAGHADAARAIAEEWLDSDRALAFLMETVGSSAGRLP